MEIIVALIIGLVVGGVVVGAGYWLYSRNSATVAVADVEKRLSASDAARSAAEAVTAELRTQSASKETEAARLRVELDAERQAKTEAATRLAQANKGFEEQKALIEAMKREMTDTFKALSGDALNSANEGFLRLALPHLNTVVVETKGKLGEHRAAMDGLIAPLSDMLKRYEEQLRLLEDKRGREYGSLTEQIRSLGLMNEGLARETGKLVTALRRPEVRGRWGEMQLKNVVEACGMSGHCDFTEQHSVDTDSGKLRPDMTVRLPGGRMIVVDAKVSLDAYLDAVAAPTEEDRKIKLLKHAQQLRTHMNRLSSKEYGAQFKSSPEIVVLFIPGEAFFSAAVQADPALLMEGVQKKVVIASPTTFMALLHAVAYGWRQEEVSKNTERIGALGKELYTRMDVLVKHLNVLGASIGKVNENYNSAIGSLEKMVLPNLRKFKELGSTGAEALQELKDVTSVPRKLQPETETQD